MPRGTKDVEKKVIQILAERLDIAPEKIKPELRLVEDLGIDSFAAMKSAFEE